LEALIIYDDDPSELLEFVSEIGEESLSRIVAALGGGR
jgi:hypothetical protein